MKLFVGLILFLLTGALYAQDIDITVSQGTQQDIIDTLLPVPASPEVDANASIEAKFKEPLNPIMTMRSVRLVKLSKEKKRRWFGFRWGKGHGKHQRVQGEVHYDPQTYTLRFIPRKPLEVGFYEIGYRHLMRAKPGPGMRIEPIVYRFYVPEVINGFKLPPEPDEKKNNETLLGIDFNRNGIRDDVERWIITRYAKDPKYPKTKTAIALQYAWASQKILENPTIESSKYEDNALACESYWINRETKDLSGIESVHFSVKNSVFGAPELKDKIFNTKERILRKFDYNSALSGHILTLKKSELSACKINIDVLGE